MAIHCDDNYIEMGCSDCFPSPPDRPLPFVFPAYGGNSINNAFSFYCSSTNPGQVGLYNGFALPFYVSQTYTNANFAHALTITIDPPPGFPGPGLVQATATMTVSGTSITITMTNNGAGYNSNAVVNHTISYFNTINVHGPTAVNMCKPIGQLINALPTYPNISLTSAKVIPQLSGTIHFGEPGAFPFNVVGRWYKNGVAIGLPQRRTITAEGEKTFTHYGPVTTFTNTDTLDYILTSPGQDVMSDFIGNALYYIQYI